MKSFRQFLVPESVEEAVSLKKAVGTRALYIAGGTTVVPSASDAVEVLIDVSGLGLAGVRIGDSDVVIGAATRHSELLSGEMASALPLLHEAAAVCATPLVRNMATVGGALAGIYLPSDIGVALLALAPSLKLMGPEERSEHLPDLLAGEWLTGHDLITQVVVPISGAGTGTSFVKFGRNEIDIALVNVASVLSVSSDGRIAGLTVSMGQSSSRPVLLTGPAGDVVGKQVTRALIEGLARSAADSVEARDDSKASAAFRKQLLEVLVGRSVYTAAERAGVRLED